MFCPEAQTTQNTLHSLCQGKAVVVSDGLNNVLTTGLQATMGEKKGPIGTFHLFSMVSGKLVQKYRSHTCKLVLYRCYRSHLSQQDSLLCGQSCVPMTVIWSSVSGASVCLASFVCCQRGIRDPLQAGNRQCDLYVCLLAVNDAASQKLSQTMLLYELLNDNAQHLSASPCQFCLLRLQQPTQHVVSKYLCVKSAST